MADDLPRRQNMAHGFTLVELLIVVVILSVIASIAVPSFKVSNAQTAKSFIVANTKVVQSAIDRYKIEHGSYPQATQSVYGCSVYTGGSASSQPAAMKNFINRMLLYTNAEGEACNSRSNGKYNLGPYLSKPVPMNPLCGYEHIYVHSSTDKKLSENTQFGWAYNYNSGRFYALCGPDEDSQPIGQGAVNYGFMALLLLMRLGSFFEVRRRRLPTA
ncbi:MAG: type II secretion system protein [Granulosicoccaceae bacterium]